MASLRRDLRATVLTQLAGLVLGIVSSVVINRALQPQGKGLLATYLVALELITALASLGLPKAVIFEIGQARSRRELVAGAKAVALVHGLGIGLLVLALGRTRLGGIVLLPGVAYGLAACVAVAGAWMAYLESILRGLNEIGKTNVAILLRRGVYFLLPLVLALTGHLTLAGVVACYLASTAAATLYLYVEVRRFDRGAFVSWPVLRSYLCYGLKYQAYSVVSQLHVRLDILIVGFLLTAEDVGYYSTAANLAQLLWNLPTAASFVLIPYVANRRLGDDASIRTAQVARISTLLLIAAGAVLAVLASWVVPWLYGAAYAPATAPLWFLLPGVVAYSIVRILGAHLIGRGRLRELTLASAAILAVNVGLNFLLIPVLGVNGSALASSVTYTLNALVVAWLVSREGCVSTRELLVPRYTDLTAAARAAMPTLISNRADRSSSSPSR